MTSTHTGEPDPSNMTCSHCNKGIVEVVQEYFPWNERHWACPKCFSTYAISLYPMTDTDYHAYTQTDGNSEGTSKNL